MSSTTINRPSGAVPSAVSIAHKIPTTASPYSHSLEQVRATRFGDFTSVGGRSAGEDKMSQGSTIGQSFPWQGSGGIWGNNTIGSGFSNGKRDASRSRGMLIMLQILSYADQNIATEDVFQNPSGSSALAASSEADAWISRGGPWNDNTSPTIPTPGSTSPLRNRSGPAVATETSPYLTALRPAIGQGHGLNGRTPVSNLDPASGSFKYSLPKTSTFGFTDEKENGSHINGISQSFGAYTLEHGSYSVSGRSSQDNSGPPSRHSETGSNGTANGSLFPSGHHFFSHTPNNSMQLERPSTQGRGPSFASSSSGRSFIELTNHALHAESNFNRVKETQNGYSESASEQSYQSHPTYPNYTSQRPQTGSSTMWNSGPGSSKGLNNFSAENYADGAFLDQLNSSKPSRLSDRGSASPGNDRRQQHSPQYYPVNDSPSLDLDPAYLRGLRPQSVADLEGRFQRLHFAPQQPYFPPHVIYGSQFQGQYPPHVYDFPSQHGFRNPYAYSLAAPPYSPALIVPRGPARDQDDGHGVRSVLLEEFRCNSKSNRRYELKVCCLTLIDKFSY
jgi:mRNA-binding protein PUF3